MSWIILITAGLFEVVWATALKVSNGFRNSLADVICIGGMVLSFWFLSHTLFVFAQIKRALQIYSAALLL